MKSFRPLTLAAVTALCAAALTVPASAQDAKALLTNAKLSIASMTGTFDGWMIVGSGKVRYPFLVTAGANGAMTYRLYDGKTRKNLSNVNVRVGTAAGIPSSSFAAPILSTSASQEDLSLWQLSWPAIGVSKQMKGGLKFFVVRVQNPSNKGAYGVADIWIHQKTGELFRIDAYDRRGKLTRKMEVQKIKRFGDQRLAEQMRITSYKSGKKDVTTYVQLSSQRG